MWQRVSAANLATRSQQPFVLTVLAAHLPLQVTQAKRQAVLNTLAKYVFLVPPSQVCH